MTLTNNVLYVSRFGEEMRPVKLTTKVLGQHIGILDACAMIGKDVTSNLPLCSGYSQAKNDFLFEKVCCSNCRDFLFMSCNTAVCCFLFAEAFIFPAG